MAKTKKTSSKPSKITQKKAPSSKSKSKASVKKTQKIKAKSSAKKQTKNTKGSSDEKRKANLSRVNLAEKVRRLEPINPVFNTQTKIILGIVIIIGLAYIFRGQFIAAMVNGQPISRFKVLRTSEEMQGSQVLDNLILEALIEQKARAEGIQITDEVVDSRIEEIRQSLTEQGQDFDQLLELQGISMQKLRSDIKVDEMINLMVGLDIDISEEEIEQYLESNRDFLPEEASEEELQQMASQQLEQQQMSQKYQEWLTNLREEANIQYFVGYGQQNVNLNL
jgi:parvulin-like peptidyl-prolyl isomerase